MTSLLFGVIYPLSLLEHSGSTTATLRLVTSMQLVSATFGAILCLVYTLFVWYAALTGIYQVDTYSNLLTKENSRRKLERAAKLTLREQLLIIFGTARPREIAETWTFDSRPLPLRGLEWTFLQTVGGITTSDEEEDLDRLL